MHGKVRACIEDVARQWSGCRHTLSASSASSFCRRAVSLHASPAADYSGGQRVLVRLDACAKADVWCGGKRLQITVYEAPHLRPCAQPPSLHAPPRASSHATSSPAVQHMHCEGACDAQCKQAAPSHPLSIQPARHSAPPQARRSRSWYLLVWAETWAWVWVVCSSSSCAFGRRLSAGLLALLSLPVLPISLGACTPAREYSLCGERLAARGSSRRRS